MPDRSWFTIRAATKPKRASVYFYDEIGWFGITAADFAREVNALDVDDLDLYINSPGGSVYDSYAIFNTLKRHKATIHATVDGMAASAASVVAQAADAGELTMLKPSTMMIHDPWMGTVGDIEAHEKSIEQLTKARDDIANVYAARSGGEIETIREAMAAETWFTAEEAVEAGLADRVAEAAPNALTTGRIYNLARFKNVPDYVPGDREPMREGVPEPIKIAANVRHMSVAAYLEHHDEAGNVDPAAVGAALTRAKNLAIPVANRAEVIRHLEGHNGRT